MNSEVFNILEKLIPNPKCELNYTKDYEFLIVVMLSAQTTDKRVNIVTKELFSKYKDLNELKNANIKDIEKIIKSLGNYTKKSKAIISIAEKINEIGYVPNNREYLESLPMVGRKTVSVVLSEIYNEPNIAVDTHVERVSKRLKISKEDSNVLKVEKDLKKILPKEKWSKTHLRLVHFGRYYCTAKNPKCNDCKLKKYCNYNKKS